jgi:hypothetical protein
MVKNDDPIEGLIRRDSDVLMYIRLDVSFYDRLMFDQGRRKWRKDKMKRSKSKIQEERDMDTHVVVFLFNPFCSALVKSTLLVSA